MDNSSIQASEDNNGGENVSNVSPLPKLSWTRRVEYILSKWADGASCFKWLHEQSYRKFKTKNNWFTIPVIILSTLTGALNVGMQGYVPDAYMGYAQIGVGSVNIFAGILTTLQSKFQYAELSESHFQAFVGWSRLARLISNELSLERNHRRNPNDLVKICKAEYERLMEQSPLIPDDIVSEFESKFGKRKELLFPDIADHLVHTEAYDDIKERKDRERDEKHFIVHKRETPPPMTDEQRMNAINRWKSLKDIVDAKRESVQPNPPPDTTPTGMEEISPPLIPKQSISARTPIPRPHPVRLPPLDTFRPERQSPSNEIRVNVKDLASKFGGAISKTFPIQPAPLSRRSSVSSIPAQSEHSVHSNRSRHSMHSVLSEPTLRTHNSQQSIRSYHSEHSIHSYHSDHPSQRSYHSEHPSQRSVHSEHHSEHPSQRSVHSEHPPSHYSYHSEHPAVHEEEHYDGQNTDDDVISNFTTFTEDNDGIPHEDNNQEKRDE